MKKAILILGLVLAGFLFACEDGGVSETQFYRETDSIHNDLNRVKDNQRIMQEKIDSIMQGMDVLQDNQKVIIYRLDTLQAGQVLIYTEVHSFNQNTSKKQMKKNFFDNAIDFLEKM